MASIFYLPYKLKWNSSVWVAFEGFHLFCGFLIKRIEFAVFLVAGGNKVARALISLLSRVCTKIKTRNFIATRSQIDKMEIIKQKRD